MVKLASIILLVSGACLVTGNSSSSESELIEAIPLKMIFKFPARYVRFYNGAGRFLCAAEDKFGDWKKERRELETCPDKNVRTIWDLQKVNSDEYTIRNTIYNEYLFDSNHNGRHTVYTWVPGGTMRQGNWQLKDAGLDFIYLMNESNDDRERRYLNGPENVYTSVEKLQKWQIIDVPNR